MNRRGNVVVNFLLMAAAVFGLFYAIFNYYDNAVLESKAPSAAAEAPPPEPKPADKPKIKAVVIVPGDPDSIAARGKPWTRFNGRAFDLATLKPAAGIEVLLRHQKSGEITGVTADARGRFKAGLMLSEGGYELRFERGGKPAAYLEDWTPSVAELDAEKRMELSKEPGEPEVLFALGRQPISKTYAVFNP